MASGTATLDGMASGSMNGKRGSMDMSGSFAGGRRSSMDNSASGDKRHGSMDFGSSDHRPSGDKVSDKDSMQLGSLIGTETKRWSLDNMVPSDIFATSYAKLKKDFIQEMRYLSKLRHPCITTGMLIPKCCRSFYARQSLPTSSLATF